MRWIIYIGAGLAGLVAIDAIIGVSLRPSSPTSGRSIAACASSGLTHQVKKTGWSRV